jgi:threonine/homoserine/homoserine lactone efflux protein
VIAGAVGISALVLASAEAFTVVKIVGATYLLWFGLKTWRDARVPMQTNSHKTGSYRALRDGIIVEALNPKTAAFFLAFVSQFVDPSAPVAAQFLFLGLVTVALNTIADVVVTFGAARIRASLEDGSSLITRAQQASGAVLCGLGVSLFFARRST